MTAIPLRLRSDGIREALVEIRFNSTVVPELTMARLLSAAVTLAPDGKVERLSLADLPAPLRRNDPNLAYQPTMQVTFPHGRLIRLGDNVVSYHALQPYPGWTVFKPEIDRAVTLAADRTTDVVVSRLGFRYLNLLSGAQEVSGLKDLNLEVRAAGSALQGPLNVNYRIGSDGPMSGVIRIATPEFVQGPQDFNALIDIEVTIEGPKTPQKRDDILAWIDEAHEFLKGHFFGLLKSEVVEKLR
jgi:uncharacterized protein (TIGR04255 family)